MVWVNNNPTSQWQFCGVHLGGALKDNAPYRMSTQKPIPDHLLEYRKFLVAAEQKSQEDFDKTVLALSGGALGISFAFLKEVIGSEPIVHPYWLLAAWLAWAFSMFAVLFSYFLSQMALRKAVSQVDKGTIYEQKAGGAYAQWTATFNATGAVLFVVGVCCIAVFASSNLLRKGVIDGNPKTSSAASAPASAASAPASAPSNTR